MCAGRTALKFNDVSLKVNWEVKLMERTVVIFQLLQPRHFSLLISGRDDAIEQPSYDPDSSLKPLLESFCVKPCFLSN